MAHTTHVTLSMTQVDHHNHHNKAPIPNASFPYSQYILCISTPPTKRPTIKSPALTKRLAIKTVRSSDASMTHGVVKMTAALEKTVTDLTPQCRSDTLTWPLHSVIARLENIDSEIYDTLSVLGLTRSYAAAGG